MLFETEKKAETFIKFNSDEIAEETGYKPERSYFCTYCGGWHITKERTKSAKSVETGTKKQSKIIKIINRFLLYVCSKTSFLPHL